MCRDERHGSRSLLLMLVVLMTLGAERAASMMRT